MANGRLTGSVTRLTSPEVEIRDGALVVERLIVTDATVVDYFASAGENVRGDMALTALTLGARSLASAAGSATMAALNDHLDGAVRHVRENIVALPVSLKDAMQTLCTQFLGEDGALVQQLGAAMATVDKNFAPESAQMQALREAIAGEVRKRVAEALTPLGEALNVNNAAGPLGLLNRNVQQALRQLGEIREQNNAVLRVQQERALSTQKGYDLEAFVAETVGQLASVLNDRFEDTSRVEGLKHKCKDGDFVATLDERLTPHALHVVIEAKHRRTGSVASLCQSLDAALENRNACVAIGVLTNPSAKTRPLAMYGKNKILVHLPGFGQPDSDVDAERQLLEMAYYLGRLLALSLHTSEHVDAFDVSCLTEQLDDLERTLKTFKTLAANLTQIETAVTRTRATADEMRDELRGILGSLRSIVAEETARLSGTTQKALRQ
jgi:hypothetical protein